MSFFQQFTYGVVSEGFFAKKMRKFCRKCAQISKDSFSCVEKILRKFCGNLLKFDILRKDLRKFCRNFAKMRFSASEKSVEILRKVRGNFQANFWNNPFPNDPMSELLIFLGFPKLFGRISLLSLSCYRPVLFRGPTL